MSFTNYKPSLEGSANGWIVVSNESLGILSSGTIPTSRYYRVDGNNLIGTDGRIVAQGTALTGWLPLYESETEPFEYNGRKCEYCSRMNDGYVCKGCGAPL